MNVRPDTESLRTDARRIDAEAVDLAARSLRLRTTTQRVRWTSLSASRYQAEVAAICSDLDAVVESLHHAAAVLRAHADSVDHIIAVLVAAEAAARTAADDAAQLATRPLRLVAALV